MRYASRIGSYCSIAHHAIIHGATVEDNCIIGINASIMEGCVIGKNSVVRGGAFLPEETTIPENSIVEGNPGKVIRVQNNWIFNRFNAINYFENGKAYAKGDYRLWSKDEYKEFAEKEIKRLRQEFKKLGE